MTTVNINDQCHVTLTKKGCQQIVDYYTDLYKSRIEAGSPTVIKHLEKIKAYKAGDVYEDSLWSIMNIFGSACYQAAGICFEENKIIIHNNVEEKPFGFGDSVYFEDVVETKSLWEIFVPTIYGDTGTPISTRHHKEWDKKVRSITNGLTICSVAKGQWINPESDELFEERIIPVRVMATDLQIHEIIIFTQKHYRQLAVMYYHVTDNVIVYTAST